MIDSDIFVGLSTGDIVTAKMLKSMAKDPIVFAMSNPNPEINYDLAMSTRKDLIMATGRSDFPNQVNNVLGFPFIFRGALDVRATKINEEMKLATAHAIAGTVEASHLCADYVIPLKRRIRCDRCRRRKSNKKINEVYRF